MINKLLILLGTLTITTQAQAFENVSGCEEADYVLVDGDTANIATRNGYTPKCLKIKAGTTVTIQASGAHPLQGQADVAGVANPFRTESAKTTPQTHTLSDVGFYGYFCVAHGFENGRGMAGSIQVVQ